MEIVHFNSRSNAVIWSNWAPRYPLLKPKFLETRHRPFSSVKMSESQPLRYVDVGSSSSTPECSQPDGRNPEIFRSVSILAIQYSGESTTADKFMKMIWTTLSSVPEMWAAKSSWSQAPISRSRIGQSRLLRVTVRQVIPPMDTATGYDDWECRC